MDTILVEPRRETFGNLLLTKRFTIPDYQRPYAWRSENIEQLWEDATQDNEIGYFVGPMVAYPTGDDEVRYDVVDGQQRLTTVVIALSLIRDQFEELGERKLAKALNKRLSYKDLNAKRRSVLKAPDAGQMLAAIISPKRSIPTAANKSERAYELAYRTVEGLLSEDLSKAKGNPTKSREILVSRRDHFLGLSVIWIEPPNGDAAHIVFETLNSRGEDLEPVDLLKNHLMRKYRPRLADDNEMSTAWSEVRAKFDRTDIGPFIHHWWVSERGYVPQNKMFAAMRQAYKGVSSKEALAVAKKLARVSEIYLRVADPDAWQPPSKELLPFRETLRALRDFQMRQPRPLLFALLRAYEEGRVSLATARSMFEAIEAFHFVHTAVVGISSSGGVTKMYARLAVSVTNANKQGQAAVLADLKRSLRASHKRSGANFESFRAAFGSSMVFTEGSPAEKRVLRYTLIRAHRLIAKSALDFDVCTIEHLESQSSNSPWVHRIGNLLIVPEKLNEKLKAKTVPEKREILANDPLAKGVDSDFVLKRTTWNQKDCEERSLAMATALFEWFNRSLS